MSDWGSCDFSSLRALSDRLHAAVQPSEIDRVYQKILYDLADALRRAAVGRTPVQTGQLRRNWQIGRVKKRGDTYEIEVYNNTEYAPWVENGHRVVQNGRTVGFCDGFFMLKYSVLDLQRAAPGITEQMLDTYLNAVLEGDG